MDLVGTHLADRVEAFVEEEAVRREGSEQLAAQALEDVEEPAILERLPSPERDGAHVAPGAVRDERDDLFRRPARRAVWPAPAVTEGAGIVADGGELDRESLDRHRACLRPSST
jgi:hypothetical protein